MEKIAVERWRHQKKDKKNDKNFLKTQQIFLYLLILTLLFIVSFCQMQ